MRIRNTALEQTNPKPTECSRLATTAAVSPDGRRRGCCRPAGSGAAWRGRCGPGHSSAGRWGGAGGAAHPASPPGAPG